MPSWQKSKQSAAVLVLTAGRGATTRITVGALYSTGFPSIVISPRRYSLLPGGLGANEMSKRKSFCSFFSYWGRGASTNADSYGPVVAVSSSWVSAPSRETLGRTFAAACRPNLNLLGITGPLSLFTVLTSSCTLLSPTAMEIGPCTARPPIVLKPTGRSRFISKFRPRSPLSISVCCRNIPPTSKPMRRLALVRGNCPSPQGQDV
mmetsp:Transcript_10790/g.23889  ORF Transcript_10790/g.23889 Transcript_10790/m.23889 type:complete len:206 (-) Transcript_10790:563-1180(-)